MFADPGLSSESWNYFYKQIGTGFSAYQSRGILSHNWYIGRLGYFEGIIMEPEMQQYTDAPEYKAEKITVDIETKKPEDTFNEVKDEASDQLKQVGEKVSAFLSDLPDYLTEFFGQYKRPIVTIGLVFAAIIAVKLLLAILDAINDIPLLAPLFELIGIAYTAWFVYRYLWKAENRRELSTDFNAMKEQVLGKF